MRYVAIQKGTQVYLEMANLIVEVDEVWFLKDMPYNRDQRGGWYFNGVVVKDYNPVLFPRVGERCKEVSHDAISGVVVNPRQDKKVWHPIE